MLCHSICCPLRALYLYQTTDESALEKTEPLSLRSTSAQMRNCRLRLPVSHSRIYLIRQTYRTISIFAKIYTETLNLSTHSHRCLFGVKKFQRCLNKRVAQFKKRSADALVTLIGHTFYLSISLSLHWQTVWIQIGPEYNTGKKVSSIEKFWHAIESLQSVNTVECPTPMRTIIHTMGPHWKQL